MAPTGVETAAPPGIKVPPPTEVPVVASDGTEVPVVELLGDTPGPTTGVATSPSSSSLPRVEAAQYTDNAKMSKEIMGLRLNAMIV